MTLQRRCLEIDVFGSRPLAGNPLVVVLEAEGLSDAEMADFARWTGRSETTFLFKPTAPTADYALRIFTPVEELPFAGHPTLGSCRAWLEAGGQPARPGRVVQECAAGLVDVELRDEETLAFAAPELRRAVQLDEPALASAARAAGVDLACVRGGARLDNGPDWSVLLLDSVEALGAAEPTGDPRYLGLVALGDAPAGAACELRAFVPGTEGWTEDPVTGSLQAAAACWLISLGLISPPYRSAQGRHVGADGLVEISTDAAGRLLVGGSARVVLDGSVEL